MTDRVAVEVQRTIGQPNDSSLGVRCAMELDLSEREASQAALVAGRIEQAFDTCHRCVSKELSLKRNEQAIATAELRQHEPPATTTGAPRPATKAQVRAIQAIAAKCDVQLTSELAQFGTRSLRQLSLRQASELIDQLKQRQMPSS